MKTFKKGDRVVLSPDCEPGGAIYNAYRHGVIYVLDEDHTHYPMLYAEGDPEIRVCIAMERLVAAPESESGKPGGFQKDDLVILKPGEDDNSDAKTNDYRIRGPVMDQVTKQIADDLRPAVTIGDLVALRRGGYAVDEIAELRKAGLL